MASSIIYTDKYYLNFLSLRGYGFATEPSNQLALAIVNFIFIIKLLFFITLLSNFMNYLLYYSESYERISKRCLIRVNLKKLSLLKYGKCL